MEKDRQRISAEDKARAVRKLRLLYIGNLILYRMYREQVIEQEKNRRLAWMAAI